MIHGMWDGKQVTGLAHRLVWQHFYGDIPDGLPLNHKNGVKADNRPENLEISTYSENMKHAHRLGLRDQTGQGNPNVKLTNAEVEIIRNLFATGEYRQVELARRFNVSFQSVSKIVKGQRRQRQAGSVFPEDHRDFYGARDETTGQFVGRRAAGALLDGKEMP